MTPDKYALYQQSVQDPHHDALLYQDFFKKARGFEARSLREDFCGTFAFSCAWVEADSRNTAMGLDLDPEPLHYGKTHHYLELTPEQKSRLKIHRKNVISTTAPQDLIVAGNFSFNIFHERETLKKYFVQCLRSLKKGRGALILDMGGGPEMIQEGEERRKISGGKLGKFTYIWDTQSFNPITHQAKYAIHFKMANGRMFKNAFTYDWRMWSIPEVRDILKEAGFKKSVVIWDVAKSLRTENHQISENGTNLDAWIAYVVGLA